MRSIKRPAAFEDLVRRLAETAHPTSKRSLFPTMRELLCFAAVLGYHVGEPTPLSGETVEIDGRIFENSPPSIDLMYLLALAHTKDAAVLRPERDDEIATIFEQYAATGLRALSRWLIDTPDDVFGDQAILSAFRKHKFLETERVTIDGVIDSVSF